MGQIDVLRQWVLTAAPVHFGGAIAIFSLLAIAGFVLAFIFIYRSRIIEDTPTSRIRSAAQGYVELSGRGALMDGTPIISPLTTTQCTWYRYKVEKMGEKHSRVVESGTSDELFLLVEDTGQCVIDPEGATVIPGTKQVWYENNYPSRRNKVFHSGILASVGSRYRYTEERMHPGEPLYALGMFVSMGGADESFNTREEVTALLREWKRDHTALLEKFDVNGDGEIDVEEWEAVRKAAHYQVRKEQTERGLKPLTHLMVKPKHSKRPFLLSVRPQHELVKHFKVKAVAGLSGFLLFGAIVVWMTTLRLA